MVAVPYSERGLRSDRTRRSLALFRHAQQRVGPERHPEVLCKICEQASHGGELAAAVEAGVVARDDVTELGAVLAGEADGRRSARDITLFDSTGLAIQDLAIAKVALSKVHELDVLTLDL
jgi:alanine dehydrogenase